MAPPGSGQDGAEELFSPMQQDIDRAFIYRNTTIAFHNELPYRPRRKRVLPRIHSVQSAIVTGPGGEDIWTDEIWSRAP